MNLKFSVITVVKNRVNLIGKAIKSVNDQKDVAIEHIIIDGLSNDGTLEKINSIKAKSSILISEKDSGIYNAINKAILISSGDIICFVHSDDFFIDDYCLSNIQSYMQSNDVDLVYGNGTIMNKKIGKTRFQMGFEPPSKYLKYGIIPSHTNTFYKRNLHDKYGLYDESFKIAGDVDFISRIISNGISSLYVDKNFIKMLSGGASGISLKKELIKLIELRHATKKNNIKSSYLYIILRYYFKIFKSL